MRSPTRTQARVTSAPFVGLKGEALARGWKKLRGEARWAELKADVVDGRAEVRGMFDGVRVAAALIAGGGVVYGLVLNARASQFPFEAAVGKQGSKQAVQVFFLLCFLPIARVLMGVVIREPVVLVDARGVSFPGIVPGSRWIRGPIDVVALEESQDIAGALVVVGADRPIVLRRYQVWYR